MTTHRYNEIDVKKINNNKKNIIKLISLKDIYGDHGIVGLYIVKEIDKNLAIIDTFLMSCRILGRYLENFMIKTCIEDSKKLKFKNLLLNFKKTKKELFFVRNLLMI